MYLKLAFRNAKRSLADYSLYIFSMVILTSIMCASNCAAAFGTMQARLQTASLPLLIVMIMTFFVGYINHFMIKQRAKEFATYLLLGMKKSRLSLLFLLELSAIGFICFFLGSLLGSSVYYAVFYLVLRGANKGLALTIIGKSVFHSLGYFCIVELLSMLCMSQTIYRLEILQLINVKRRSQSLTPNHQKLWRGLFLVSFLVWQGLFYGIAVLPSKKTTLLIAVVSLPVLCCIFAFYQWIYALLKSIRLAASEGLYQGRRLYWIAELTSSANTNAGKQAIFSICLLFSGASFLFGTLLLHPDFHLFAPGSQRWMGFLQISICIIFIVLYFSILSLLLILELRQQTNPIKILHYMGKSPMELSALIKHQILIKLWMPAFMCFLVLGIATPLVNYKINPLLPPSMQNLLVTSLGGFAVCFLLFCLCYYEIIYNISKHCL